MRLGRAIRQLAQSANTHTTVSYTHLDVYKRQIPVYRKVWKGIGFFALGVMSLAFEYVNVSFPVMLLAGYLDVYKRQGSGKGGQTEGSSN